VKRAFFISTLSRRRRRKRNAARPPAWHSFTVRFICGVINLFIIKKFEAEMYFLLMAIKRSQIQSNYLSICAAPARPSPALYCRTSKKKLQGGCALHFYFFAYGLIRLHLHSRYDTTIVQRRRTYTGFSYEFGELLSTLVSLQYENRLQ
jgi:hypothetical protein